jgi:hypothetical protein
VRLRGTAASILDFRSAHTNDNRSGLADELFRCKVGGLGAYRVPISTEYSEYTAYHGDRTYKGLCTLCKF